MGFIVQQFENEEFYVAVDFDGECPLFDAACVVFSIGRKMLDLALAHVPMCDKVLSGHPCGRSYLTLNGVRTLCRKSKSKQSRLFRDWFETVVVSSLYSKEDIESSEPSFIDGSLCNSPKCEHVDYEDESDSCVSSSVHLQDTDRPNSLVKHFNSNAFKVRVIVKDDAPWFVSKDVCDCLCIANSRDAVSRLDADEKGVGKADTLGGSQDMTMISESGLYALIMRSNKPEAKSFRKWVTSEVLPAIRKTGMYVPQHVMDRISVLEQMVLELRDALPVQNQKISFRTARDVCEELGLDVVDTTFKFIVSSYMKNICDQHHERETYSRGFNGIRVFPSWVTDEFVSMYRSNPKILDPYLP